MSPHRETQLPVLALVPEYELCRHAARVISSSLRVGLARPIENGGEELKEGTNTFAFTRRGLPIDNPLALPHFGRAARFGDMRTPTVSRLYCETGQLAGTDIEIHRDKDIQVGEARQ